ncbi:helix-turn-helix domain-containing protein [Psychromonas sp.]|uniref:helix-turn-helix domain-containing protein n=1 Tax=Psychromonas sp. TaxID=1884585 RepID=UPI0039E4A3A9
MMVHNASRLLLIAFDSVLARRCCEDLRIYCDIDCISSMADLERSVINPGAVIYLMDHTSANHLYNINFIRHQYPDKQFFVISASVSIPLLQQSLHTGVNDLFIYPLSEQDKQALLCTLKNKTSVDIFNELPVTNSEQGGSKIIKEHPLFVVLELIERDYTKSLSLQDLSNAVHLSPSRVCHLFKDICGITYSCYMLCRKIEESERLLAVAKSSISSISYQIGFANPSHFCRTFKEYLNITPTAYANGNRDVEYSPVYLQYQRLRSELFLDLAREVQEQSLYFVGKHHAS